MNPAPPSSPALQLRILGEFELLRVGSIVRLPKKAQALLAMLALSSGPVSKEMLATRLWGHTGTQQARASLRQCLVALRSSLAEHAALILADGPAIAFADAGAVAIDAAEFLRLAKADNLDDLQRASSLFRDTLLSGIHIPIEPFERWLAVERQRFDAALLDLLQRLAASFAAVKENEKAIATCRKLLALDPLREEGHRLLMTILADTGNRGSALLHYEQCVEIIKDELGVAPDPETIRLAESIRKGVVPGREALMADKGPAPAGVSSASTVSPPLPLPDKPSIAILPFAHLGHDRGQEYFVQGLVEDIAVALGRESWLFVVASPWGAAAENDGIDLRDLGSRLGVQYLLKGSVRLEGDESLFVVQLLDAARGAHVWSGRFRDRIDNLFDVQERLTTQVAATIAPALMSFEVERARHQPTGSLSAFHLYLRALPLFRASKTANQEALELLSRAVEIDPSYATAHALAARCYQFQLMFGWRLPGDPEIQAGIRHGHQAARLGSNDPEALWMAGLALVHLSGELDYAQALIERSLVLNPNSANAWTASCLVQSYLGNTDPAIDHFGRAQRLNPLDVSQHLHWNTVAWAYLGAGRIQEAAEAAERTLRVQPDYPPGLRLKAVTFALLGRLEEARSCVKVLMLKQPSTSIGWMRAFLETPLVKNKQALETYLDGARLAGVPDGG